MNKNIIMVVVLAVGLAIGFGGGMMYQKSKVSTLTAANGNFGGGQGGGQFRRGMGGNGGNFNGMRATIGTILNADASSVTVKMADGSSKIALINDKTTIGKNATATAADLTTGAAVQVFGTANSDGSITAQNIQLNPEQRMMRPNVSVTPTQ